MKSEKLTSRNLVTGDENEIKYVVHLCEMFTAARCKALEQQEYSLAALKNVGVQAVVTEFLISHADILFTDDFINRRREPAAG